jgi:hypothetical protein
MTVIRKDGPDAGDVHVPTTEGKKRKKTQLQAAMALLEKAVRRWPAGAAGGRGGQFAPTNAGDGMGAASGGAGRRHPAPPDISRFDQSHAGVRRIATRMAAMDAAAARGDIEAIRSMTTSRGNSYLRTEDNYRNQLLQHFDPQVRLNRLRGTMPQAPDITSANMANPAVVSARRHVHNLQQILANNLDPTEALLNYGTIGSSRTNGYTRQAQSYHLALLAHFAGGEAAAARAPDAPAPRAPRARPQLVSPAPAPQPEVRVQPVSPSISHTDTIHQSANGIAFSRGQGRSTQHDAPFGGAIGNVRNTTFRDGDKTLSVDDAAVSGYAANQQSVRISELGFIPRPNVPLQGVTVTREGQLRGGAVTPWSTEAQRQLAVAYLSQPTALQSRAREYQQGTWQPETPAVRAARAEAARQEGERLAAMQRQAAMLEESRRASVPAAFRVQARPGNNVTRTTTTGYQSNSFVASSFATKEGMANFAKTLIADYGQGVKFTAAIAANGSRAEVAFSGDDGTEMRRQFTSNPDGSVSVYHAYFKAGRKGDGAGKRFFRVAMGEYMAAGVKDVGVTANLDVGGYAWARYGYLPSNNGVWDGLRSQLKGKLDRMTGVSDADKAAMTAILNKPDRRALWEVSDARASDGSTIGKKLLLGTNWSGRIDLNDEEQMRRFTAYVSQG